MLKVLVPAGFMPTVSSGTILVQLCSGQGPQTVMMELPGRSGDHDPADHKQADMPCAFSGLSSPALAAADPILLALAIALILAIGRTEEGRVGTECVCKGRARGAAE